MNKSYQIAANRVEHETVITRSRFLCYLAPCCSTEDARAMVKELQQQHPSASHHCYAYLSAAPDDSQYYGFSDDGEPNGTAGKPMLSVLQGFGVGQICAVVVRYFGGTKLGTGGLQRAYSASVREALAFLQAETKIPMVNRRLSCQYTQVNDILHLLEQFGGKVTEQAFFEQVDLQIALPEQELESLSQALQTMSAGQLVLNKITESC